jgi:hypothetical protein
MRVTHALLSDGSMSRRRCHKVEHLVGVAWLPHMPASTLLTTVLAGPKRPSAIPLGETRADAIFINGIGDLL